MSTQLLHLTQLFPAKPHQDIGVVLIQALPHTRHNFDSKHTPLS